MTGAIVHRIICLSILAAAALGQPAKAQAVQEYRYEQDAIYTIRTGLGITTQIELSPSEKIVDYSTGFSSGWELTRRDNVFYLKPKNVDVDTNMMVRTETHSYIFELKVVATDWVALEQAKHEGVQYKVRFTYPSGTEFAARADVAPGLSPSLAADRSYNFDYDYATRDRSVWLVPVNVYDDGQFTYIHMNDMKNVPSGNFPAVFAREREDGDDYVVNTTVQDDTIVVHGTYSYLVIRYSKNVVGLRRNANQ
jgi:type IV secretion system protein VirB9